MSEPSTRPTSSIIVPTLHNLQAKAESLSSHPDAKGEPSVFKTTQEHELGVSANQVESKESELVAPLEQSPRRRYAIFFTALPLLLHGLFVIATSCFVLLYLDNNNFAVKHRDLFKDERELEWNAHIPFFEHWIPLQTDMITTLSVLIVAARFFLTVWCVDVAWKCIFILLEQTGLSVSQISDLIKYKVLWRSGLPSRTLPKGRRGYRVLVAIMLFLPFPAHISSPIITGSITWTPSYELLLTTPLDDVSVFTNGIHWSRYQNDSLNREEVIADAQRLYNLFYPSTYTGLSAKRSILAAFPRALGPNSTISNVTMPYISLGDLEWISDKNLIPMAQQNAADFTTGWLNITPFNRDLILREAFALIPPKQWTQAKKMEGASQDPHHVMTDIVRDLVTDGISHRNIRVGSMNGGYPYHCNIRIGLHNIHVSQTRASWSTIGNRIYRYNDW